MSKELVPSPRTIAVEEQNAKERRAVLERLNAEAETADAARARQIMLQARMIAEALDVAKGSFEEARLAGKASVLAARRLGKLMLDLSGDPGPGRIGHKGPGPSPRRLLSEQLGICRTHQQNLVRLAQVADPDFQRYIQRTDIIPSFNRALWDCSIVRKPKPAGSMYSKRRRRLGITDPRNPSIDEAYSLIIKALAHLGALSNKGGGGKQQVIARGRAMDHLYAAEDLLKPYRAGYGEPDQRAA